MPNDRQAPLGWIVIDGGAARFRRRLELCERAVHLLCLPERSPELDAILCELEALASKPVLTVAEGDAPS